jgi:hypothetical protein
MPQDAPFLVANNAQRGDIPGYNGAHSNYGAIAYCRAWHDTYIHTYPHVATNDNRFKLKALVIWKTVSPVTMVDRIEGEISAYMTVVTYLKPAVALYPGVIPDVHVIANHYIFCRVNDYSAMETNPLTTYG